MRQFCTERDEIGQPERINAYICDQKHTTDETIYIHGDDPIWLDKPNRLPRVAIDGEDKPAGENPQERKQFEELDRLIRNEQLFLDPELTRTRLLRRIRIAQNRLSPLIQTYTGKNFSGYINSLRLDHAVRLLKDEPAFTIEAIAFDSGFNHVRTFQRLFKSRYGMTPTEWREGLQKEFE